jgi:pyruvate-formate lyase-activating enzyme
MVAPCCQADTAVESIDTFNFTSSQHLNAIRKKFDKNIQAIECNRCWNDEKFGKKSRRQSAIEFFNISAPNRDIVFESLDYSSTWACNLACIMCGPNNSSTWAVELSLTQDQLHSLGRKFQKKNKFLNQLDLTSIRKIHFNGGEPLINNDQLNLLRELDQIDVLKNVFISYNTNGTINPNDAVKEYWSKARLVKLFFSIDAIGTAFEYIRWPAKWAETENNILNLKKTSSSNIMFGINATLGVYNMFEMSDVVDWFEKNLSTNREGDHSDFNVQYANNYHPRFAQKDIKIAAIEHLSKQQKLSGVVSYLQSTIDLPSDNSWIDHLNNIDRRRNTNWSNTLVIGKYYKDSMC